MHIKIFLDSAFEFHEREVLLKFYDGIKKTTDSNFTVDLDLGRGFSQCDVGIIFGSWKPKERDHHAIRNSVAEFSPNFIVIETPLLNRKVHEENSYYRIGINGFLNNQGLFHYGNHSSERANKLNCQWNGWRNHGNEIVLFLQLPGDASLRGTNIYQWALFTIKEIRKRSHRPIKIRTHPKHNIKDTDEFYKLISDITLEKIPDVFYSFGKEKTLIEDLSSAYCTVAFTSGSSIDSIIHGIPTVACDPGNFAYQVSSNYLDEIENVKKLSSSDIQLWINNLAYSQWSINEMHSGEAWRHLLPLLTPLIEAKSKKKK
jgi:hypothetical protein